SIEQRPAEVAEENELRERLDEALEQLPEAQRSVFVMHVMEQLQYKEIAEVMDCSIGTVMSRLHYARQKLQGILKRYLVTPES
ncbi:MAG: sigma-70 family RNA polymerase sigma factor, partial [Planctomycetota bacterium]|nr:sigma-70 family RNA polymerase sigma factor [Planctomycetota bacterium]